MTPCFLRSIDSFNFHIFKVIAFPTGGADTVLFQYGYYCVAYSLWLFHLFHWDVGMVYGTFKKVST